MEFKRMIIQRKAELGSIIFRRRFLRLIVFIATLILAFAKTSACRNTEDPEEPLSIKSSKRDSITITSRGHGCAQSE